MSPLISEVWMVVDWLGWWGGLVVRWQTCELLYTVAGIVLLYIILFASSWVQQLKVLWFGTIIPVTLNLCWTWLESQWNGAVLKNMKCCANKDAWMTATILVEFLVVLAASVGVQGKNMLLLADNCAAYQQKLFVSMECKVYVFTKHHKDWVWLGAEKGVHLHSFVCVFVCVCVRACGGEGSDLAICCIPSINTLKRSRVLAKPVLCMKLLNHLLMCAALKNLMNEILWTWNSHWFFL